MCPPTHCLGHPSHPGAYAITCECCGEPGKLQRSRHWTKTLCHACADPSDTRRRHRQTWCRSVAKRRRRTRAPSCARRLVAGPATSISFDDASRQFVTGAAKALTKRTFVTVGVPNTSRLWTDYSTRMRPFDRNGLLTSGIPRNWAIADAAHALTHPPQRCVDDTGRASCRLHGHRHASHRLHAPLGLSRKARRQHVHLSMIA